MIDPRTRVLGLLADGAITVDEAEHLLWAIRSVRPAVTRHRRESVRFATPMPALPTLPSYFAGLTGDRVM